MYMECDEMNIKNVDENGNEIMDIDWSVWRRDYVEEVLDDDENVVGIISHCKKFSEEELHEQLLQKLAETESDDIQSAICELAEQQIAYENDVNAALCELYDLISGGDSDG